MLQTLNPPSTRTHQFHDKLGFVRRKIARSMVGSTVDLMADSDTIAHGIVTGIFMKAGSPKIIVNGRSYDLHQVVTATSGSL